MLGAPPLSSDAEAPARRATRGSLALWVGTTLVFGLAALAVAFETAMHFSGSAIDGPFQLYDAMRRLAAGFHPGIDFQYFHGLGLPYVYYWFYKMLGGGLPASELARELITTALFPLVLIGTFRAFERDWRRVLALTTAAFALSFALHLAGVIYALNSMIGLRSALPTLTPAVWYAVRSRRTRVALVGAMMGASLFVSTEQGLALLAAFFLAGVLVVVRASERRGPLLEWVASLVLAVVVLFALLVIVAGVGGARGALAYNFRIVPRDQYWFFGAPPNRFVSSWRTGLQMLLGLWQVGLVILLAVLYTVRHWWEFWRMPESDLGRRRLSLGLLALYGLLSCASLLGVFTFVYSQPCWRVVLVLTLLEIADFATRYDLERQRTDWLGVPRGLATASLLLTAYTFGTIPVLRVALMGGVRHIVVDHGMHHAGFTVEGIWPATLADAQRVIDAHRSPSGATPQLWSTYSGWIEARNDIFNPSFDYIIHALGPDNRQAYVDRFRSTRPVLVQTVRPTYTQYEPWLENADWAWYDELLTGYRPIAATPWSLFWERRTTPAPEPRLIYAASLGSNTNLVRLPAVGAQRGLDSAGSPALLLEVELDYDVHNPLHALPIIGATPRYLVGIVGALSSTPVSLDPWVHRARFPLVVQAGRPPVLLFQTFSLLPGASWTPRSIRVWVRPLDADTNLWFYDLLGRLLGR